MTDDELRKLDVDVAREVMGYDPCPCWFSFNTGPQGECERCGKRCALPYARSIAAAWQVVEKITENPLWDFFLAVRPHLATAHFHDGNAVDFEEMDESVPVAICLAALKAVRAGKPQVNA